MRAKKCFTASPEKKSLSVDFDIYKSAWQPCRIYITAPLWNVTP